MRKASRAGGFHWFKAGLDDKGKLIACTYCEFKTVCRFDSWVNPFNVLTKPKANE